MSAESEILLIKKSFSITPPIDPPLTVGEDFSLSTQEIYFSDSIFDATKRQFLLPLFFVAMSVQSKLYPPNHKNASVRSWLHLPSAVLT